MKVDIALASARLSGSPSWFDSLAEAIENLDNDRCPLLLIAAIGSVVDVEMAMSLVYSGRSRPVHVCDTFNDEKAKRGLANYVKNTYVLNPFYAAYRRGLRGGVYRIRDLAPGGRAAKVLRANLRFMTIPVEAGPFEVTFEYRPKWLLTSIALSGAGLLLCAGFVVYPLFKRT